jgi:hypothetical protein
MGRAGDVQAGGRLWPTIIAPKENDGNRSRSGGLSMSKTPQHTAKVLDMIEQCLSLPGEFVQIIKQYLYIQCTNNGCSANNQLQKLLSIKDRHGL